MQVRYFTAILERTQDGFSVFFPDLPGLASHGATAEEAAAEAEAALAFHLRGMAEDREPIPEPTPLEKLGRDPEVEEFARILVCAELPGKAVRFNASFEESLLAQVDAAAERRGMTRSGFLAEGARVLLRTERDAA